VGRSKILRADDAIELVFQRLVVETFKNGEGVAFLVPGDAFVGRFGAIEGYDRTRGHIAELQTVAGFFRSVNGKCEEAARLVEGELADVADVEFVAGGKLVEEEVAALPFGGGRFFVLRVSGVFVQSDPAAAFTAEGEGFYFVKILFLAGGEVDESDLVVGSFLVALRLARLGAFGEDLEGEPFAIFGEFNATLARRASGATASSAGNYFADEEAGFLRILEIADDEFAIAFVGDHAIGEIRAVAGHIGSLDALPTEDVGDFDGAGCGEGEQGDERGNEQA
jgi:hypothetical protein